MHDFVTSQKIIVRTIRWISSISDHTFQLVVFSSVPVLYYLSVFVVLMLKCDFFPRLFTESVIKCD